MFSTYQINPLLTGCHTWSHHPFSHWVLFPLLLYLCSAAAMLDTHQCQQPRSPTGQSSLLSWLLCSFSLSGLFFHREAFVHLCVCECVWMSEGSLCALYWKASRNMSTTLMMMSSIMMRNTTTFWVSGGRLQCSMVLRTPILCLLHLPEPLPRAISSLASSCSSSSALPPLPRLLSLSAEPPHHTAPPRPPLRLSPSLSSSDAALFLSALAVASCASPATLPMPSVAPACPWRLGAYLCQRLCESAHCGAICVLRAEHHPLLLLPYSLLRNRHLPWFLLSLLHQDHLYFPFNSLILCLGQDVRMKDGGQDATFVQFMLMPPFPFFLLPLSLFSVCSSLAVAYIGSDVFSNHPAISSLLYLSVSAYLFSRLRAPTKMVLRVLPEAALPQPSI